MKDKVVTTILLYGRHDEWRKKRNLNLSAWVRSKIDEEIGRENRHGDS